MDSDQTSQAGPGRRPIEHTREVDALCDEYEAALGSGTPPPFSPYIDRIDDEVRETLLRELVALATEHLRDEGCEDPTTVILAENSALRVELERLAANDTGEAATVLLPPPGSGDKREARTQRVRKSRGVRLRCPHCSNHVELVGDTPLDSVDCGTCGSTFSIVDHGDATGSAEPLRSIDRFEIVSRLGLGGFGTVWKARDTELGRAVAIKIPRRGQLTPKEVEQFLREARSAAQLTHPNIVPVHEIGREGEDVFIVSDLIRGVSLADRLTGDRLTVREAVELCRKVADALAHAHQRGVVHRDLKPSNVMIDDLGEPHLMDFGLAKRQAEEVTMTVEGQVIGTPAYMSPEQASGRSAWADHRCDIYSLGVVMFELLTGERPFRGNAQLQVHLRQHEDAPSVRKLNPHVPRDLATVCAKCLEREPGRRYQSVAEVRNELSRVLNGEPIRAREISPIERATRWAVRRPMRASLAGLVVGLAIVGPTVALQIEGQRQRLVELNQEKDNLLLARQAEASVNARRLANLESKLSTWEGRANPWSVWPPDPSKPPRQQQATLLLAAREAALIDQQPTDRRTNAQRWLALATLHEAAGKPAEAINALTHATHVLEALRSVGSTEPAGIRALADAYERLSWLSAERDPDASLSWLRKSARLLEAEAESTDAPGVTAALQETQLRIAAASGFEDAADWLGNATELEAKLTTSWPESPAAIYELACELAGRPVLLGSTGGLPESSSEHVK